MTIRRLRNWAACTRGIQVSALVLCSAVAACGDDDDGDANTSDAGETDAGEGGRSGSSAGGRGGTAGGATAGRGGSGGTAGRTQGGSGGSAGTTTAGRGGAGGQASSDDAGPGDDDAGEPSNNFSFFVTSDTSTNGDLGGLTGADERCQDLAAAVGAGAKTWHAYLSVEHDAANGDNATNARDRISSGPWYNVNGVLLAQDLAALHARQGDDEVFLNERGQKINGQWSGSPTPNEHDIFTGSSAEGTLLVGKTCEDWTSSSADLTAQVGHSDGLGPMQNGEPPYNSWNSVHENESCSDTAPRGGAGKLYCFAVN